MSVSRHGKGATSNLRTRVLIGSDTRVFLDRPCGCHLRLVFEILPSGQSPRSQQFHCGPLHNVQFPNVDVSASPASPDRHHHASRQPSAVQAGFIIGCVEVAQRPVEAPWAEGQPRKSQTIRSRALMDPSSSFGQVDILPRQSATSYVRYSTTCVRYPASCFQYAAVI